ncbi:beta-glucoside-specific PTS transporter subunit IIABC [Enorma phocaeensis]|uniref:Beta-glucoside-specific PTS transporter subunit IIABC n=1 Tax=Enorma phocaeensis TaxID=1871019 RepID=A0ABT7V8J7_9ACTN|nr:beta-glucoside-specific PTS transporter subunit IIABC [Enorma phocaeensis]MDM8274818.1 beta-glucoside-specific PTS transporter subunit IIABC [Enorma phocaeensis]
MNPDTLASQIIEAVGGKDNVREVFHCVTRLRFYLNDLSKADEERLKKTNGVLGVVNTTEQLQIIIGNEVDTVCNAVQAQLGPIDAKAKLDADVAKNKEEMKKFRIGGIFETISAIILPVIPAMAGTGILKGVVTIMTSYLGFASDDVLIQVLTMAADSVFYFLPFFLAWSSAKRFKTDIAMALVIAGILLYPTMTAGQSAGSDPMYLFGVLPIPFAKYSASSIPIILSVWVMSYVYKYVDKFIPKMLRLVFAPLVTVLIMAPVALVVTGPIANYLAQAIATLFTWLFTVSPLIAGAVIGATRSLLVFTGMHLSLGAVCLNNISVLGYDYILPVNTMGTMAIVGCCLGVWICAKKSENKEIGMSTFVSSFLGITEPGIYGVLMTFRTALIADIIAGGIAGAFVATIGCHAYAYVNSCILSLPVFVDENFVFMCIGMALATALGCGLTIFFGLDEGDGIKARLFSKKAEPAPAVEAAGAATPSVAVAGATNSVDVVASPLTGSVSPLSETPDAVFASGALGKGVVIEPTEGVLRSPFDGTVTAVYPSKHAIGVTSDSGVECLIHIGIDTVNLGGKHFEMAVEQGQHVQAGDTLLTFDIDAIKAAGYSVVSPVIISNTASYLDVFPVNERGAVKAGDELIKTLK